MEKLDMQISYRKRACAAGFLANSGEVGPIDCLACPAKGVICEHDEQGHGVSTENIDEMLILLRNCVKNPNRRDQVSPD